MDKFRDKLPKEDLKRFARDINKKLVASDYKNNRVKDPTAALGDKEERKVKKYVKEFFDKAVIKYREHEKRKKAKPGAEGAEKAEDEKLEGGLDSSAHTPTALLATEDLDPDDVVMSDRDDDPSPDSPDRKRKRQRDAEAEDTPELTPSDEPSTKRLKEDGQEEQESQEGQVPSPPPPPPPPPDAAVEDVPEEPMTEDQKALREQEEALMRENEEAQRLEDEAEREEMRKQEEALIRENEEAMRSFEARTNLDAVTKNDAVITINGGSMISNHADGANGGDADTLEDGHALNRDGQTRKQEVLSH